MNRQTAIKYRKYIEQAAGSLSDEDALNVPEMYPHWRTGIPVTANSRIFHEGKLYRVVQAHTTQEDWRPDIAPALFTEVAKPGEIPVWKQPTGAQDAYSVGDRVYYPDKNGAVYESEVDSNVWQPGVYGWKAIFE